MKDTKKVKLKNLDKDHILFLLELMVYSKMSYPSGYHNTCQVQIDCKNNIIVTEDKLYHIDEDDFVFLYLKSNEMIAEMYKYLYNNEEVTFK